MCLPFVLNFFSVVGKKGGACETQPIPVKKKDAIHVVLLESGSFGSFD